MRAMSLLPSFKEMLNDMAGVEGARTLDELERKRAERNKEVENRKSQRAQSLGKGPQAMIRMKERLDQIEMQSMRQAVRDGQRESSEREVWVKQSDGGDISGWGPDR